MSEENYLCIKFKTGEEILCIVLSEDEEKFTIINPVKYMMIPPNLTMSSFLNTINRDVKLSIKKEDILLTCDDIHPKIIEDYIGVTKKEEIEDFDSNNFELKL